MAKKADAEHKTPKRKRQPRRAPAQRDQDNPPKNAVADPWAEYVAKRSRPLWVYGKMLGMSMTEIEAIEAREAAEQERVRLFGEKHGLNLIAEKLRKAETAPPMPQESTPPRKPRKGGGGRKPSLTQEQIKKGIRILQSQSRMTVEAARWTLRDAGIDTTDTALYQLVIRPAYGSAIRK